MIDIKDNNIIWNFGKRTNTVFLTIDSALQLIEKIELLLGQLSTKIDNVKIATELYEVKIGVWESGIALCFNRTMNKIVLNQNIAAELIKKIRMKIQNKILGCTFKIINQGL